jgi:hypothetical protein
MDVVLATLKSLDASDLFKVLKTVVAEAEKKAKSDAKSSGASGKKKGSAPKGVVPNQLRKPRAWVEFTLQHALVNGWESFTVRQTKKDKVSGEKVEEEIEMPGSVLHDGAHVYEDSVNEKNPAGKQLIHKDAMSLSKQRWAPKEKKGSHPELYEEFEGSYVEEAVSVSETASTTSSKVVVKMTAAEKAAAAEAKKAEKEAEKDAPPPVEGTPAPAPGAPPLAPLTPCFLRPPPITARALRSRCTRWRTTSPRPRWSLTRPSRT